MIYRYQWEDKVYQIDLERHAGGYQVVVDGVSYDLQILDNQPGELSILFEGRPVTLYWASDESKKWVSMDGCTYALEKPASERVRRAGETSAEGTVRAPMPAQVRALHVSGGDRVQKGDTLLLLEAMKMEIRIQAPLAGRVARVLISTGQNVNRGEELVILEAE